jgi:hypothetical protein
VLTPTIKVQISAQIESAIQTRRIHWRYADVVEWPLAIGKLSAKVRFVPTFAYRQLLYDSPDVVDRMPGCRLCAARTDQVNEITISPPRAASSWFERFEAVFELRHNNFPYFDGQFLVATRDHIATFGMEHYELLLRFLSNTRFAAAAVQIEGSGATIPDHAHIAVCDEPLPIFELEAVPCERSSGTTVGNLIGYPGSAYVVAGGGYRQRAERITSLTESILDAGYSFNLFIDHGESVYLVPRSSEYASSIGRKMGSVEVAGVYLGNALGADTRDITELEALIQARCASMTPEAFLDALRETVVASGVLSFSSIFDKPPRARPTRTGTAS